MSDQKKLVVNCDLCDARKINEEDYKCYESITLNTDVIFVDERSKSILNRLPMTLNMDMMYEAKPGIDYNLQIIDGRNELNAQSYVEENTFLIVNGSLSILPDAKDVLKNYEYIIVNGTLKYPEDLSLSLDKMQVNGAAVSYPKDCRILEEEFVMDYYFPMRAKSNARYFAENRVIITDSGCDLFPLIEKKVRFVTKELLVLEEKVKEAIALVDETVRLTVIPEGYTYVNENVLLDERILRRYGNKLYIDGDLTIGEESLSCLPQLEGLKVTGDVLLKKRYQAEFEKIDAEYRKMVIIKGRVIENCANVSLDAAALDLEPDGIAARCIAHLELAKDISSENIMNHLEIENCACVICSEKQKAAVTIVSKNVAKIITDEAEENKEEQDDAAPAKKVVRVNADQYIL